MKTKITLMKPILSKLAAVIAWICFFSLGLSPDVAQADSLVNGQMYYSRTCYYDEATMQMVFPDAAPGRGYVALFEITPDLELVFLSLFKTDKDGRFAMSLPQGHYIWSGTVAHAGPGLVGEAIVTEEDTVFDIELYCCGKKQKSK